MREIDYEILENLEAARFSLMGDIQNLRKYVKRDPYLTDLIARLEDALDAVQVDIDRYEELEAKHQGDDDPSDPEFGYDRMEEAI